MLIGKTSVRALLACATVTAGILLSALPEAKAATFQCPTPSASFNRIYELSSAIGCAYGQGNLENLSQPSGVTVTAYQGTYPNPPAPNTGVYPIPATANLLGTYDPAGG